MFRDMNILPDYTYTHVNNGQLAELKCRARVAFSHEIEILGENEDKLHSQTMLSKLQRGECNDFCGRNF